jgi:hypothetical protein
MNTCEECPICFESGSCLEKTPCGHAFCQPCLNTHLMRIRNCPMCRGQLNRPLIDEMMDLLHCNHRDFVAGLLGEFNFLATAEDATHFFNRWNEIMFSLEF